MFSDIVVVAVDIFSHCILIAKFRPKYNIFILLVLRRPDWLGPEPLCFLKGKATVFLLFG